MRIEISTLPGPAQDELPVEVVERKGIGHPDTICDGLAEAMSAALAKAYRARTGRLCHYNVDKVLLAAGTAVPSFGGGVIMRPIEIYLAGRATLEVEGERLPIEEIARTACLDWLRQHLHALDPERHVRLHVLLRPGSHDLTELFLRQQRSGVVLANDTSCGVGYAPPSKLERTVLAIDRALTSSATLIAHPAIGEDIKIMAVRQGKATRLTISTALIGAHLVDVAGYCSEKAWIAEAGRATASSIMDAPAEVQVNAADDVPESLYLTASGTSAEMGDDGEAGRGNRVNGLITPYRPMTMESVAGKNPVSHVGKLYNVAANRIARSLVDGIDEVQAAQCVLVSRIGAPVGEPQIVDIRLLPRGATPVRALTPRVEAIVQAQLAHLGQLSEDLIEGRISLDSP
jgi:S-adenosylmethionine synthetase